MMLSGASARAADLKEALARFAADDFSETATGITEVAETGDPRAATIIEALQNGRLLYQRGAQGGLLQGRLRPADRCRDRTAHCR